MRHQSELHSWKLPEAVKRVWEACLLRKHPIILFALYLRADTVAYKQVCFCNQFHNLEVWQTQIRLNEFYNVWECASHRSTISTGAQSNQHTIERRKPSAWRVSAWVFDRLCVTSLTCTWQICSILRGVTSLHSHLHRFHHHVMHSVCTTHLKCHTNLMSLIRFVRYRKNSKQIKSAYKEVKMARLHQHMFLYPFCIC